MNYLALDIGKKKIGIAISQSAIISNELETIINDKDALEKISQIILDKEIDVLVVGFPKNMDDTDSIFSEYVKDFINKLLKIIKIKVEFVDERLTTQEAYRQLREMGLDKKEVESRVDQYAAKIILEDYLA